MSRVAHSQCLSRRLLGVSLLSASVLVTGMFGVAKAQSLLPLRGEISEDEAANDLSLKRRKQTGDARGNAGRPTGNTTQRPSSTSSTEYEPFSPGGLTEAEERNAEETFDDQSADMTPADPFSDAAPIPQARPSSSRRNASDEGERAEATSRTGTAQSRARQRQADQEKRAKAEEEFTTGTVRQARADSEFREELRLDAGSDRADAIESLGRRSDEKPFEAVGIRAGTFILRPSVEQGVTYTTNADSSPDGGESVQSETTLRLNAVSDWSQNRASLDAYGIFDKALSGEDVDEKEGGIDAVMELDLSHEYKLKSTAGYSFKPESASSPVLLGNVTEQPLRHNFNTSLGLSKDLGKLEFGVTARADRNVYDDADVVGGGTLDQSDRNSTLATVALRTGYEISPAIKPFAELEVGRRMYDEQLDAAGYERSADRLAARAGLELDMREKLTGEFSAGWLRESFDDNRLETISGLNLNADLRWSPERETTVGLNASTSVEGTTTAGESGSVLHTGKLSVERQVRSNLTANAALGLDYRTYSGTGDHDLKWSAELGATWWLNRYAGLTGRLRHEQQTSDLPGRDYKADSVFVGIKVQR